MNVGKAYTFKWLSGGRPHLLTKLPPFSDSGSFLMALSSRSERELRGLSHLCAGSSLGHKDAAMPTRL